MICTYCQGFSPSQSRFYQISNVKQRFIPTYYHHPIFSQAQPQPQKIRCSPTFHSKAIDISGYHRCNSTNKDLRSKNTSAGIKIPKSTYKADHRRCKDETFYNYRGGSCYNSRCRWYDGGKEEVLMNLNEGRLYSRERKLADLASSSVFQGYTLKSYQQTNFEHAHLQQGQQPVRESLEDNQNQNPNPQGLHRAEAYTQTIDNQQDKVQHPQKYQPAEQTKEQPNTRHQAVTFGKQQNLKGLAPKTKSRPSKVVKSVSSTKPCFTVIRNKR